MKSPTKSCSTCDGTGQVIDDSAVGEELRQMRESAGYSLREIATKLGYSAAYVSDLELGHRKWSAAKVASYRQAIGKKAA